MNLNFYTMHGPRTCPYTYNGKNLAEIRKARLRPIAQRLKIPLDGDPPKNELLGAMIARLKLLEADSEISDLVG